MSHNRKKLVVLAGATGYLGKHMVRALTERGIRVRALARNPAKLEELSSPNLEVFVGEATKKESLDGLFDGAGFAFSSIGVRHFHRRPTFEEVDYQANINLVELAEAAKVGRFGFVSVLDGPVIRATSPLVNARERVVERLIRSPMSTLLLRPTGFFNDLGDYLKMAKAGRAWLIGSGETRLNPVSGRTLAEVGATALLDSNSPTELAVGGPDTLSQREIAELAFTALGRPPKYGHIPTWLVRGIGNAVRPFNANASAIALMFSILGERDAVAPAFGGDHLAEYFQQLQA